MQALNKWISVKDKKRLPKALCACYVKNDKGWMHGVLALYHPEQNAFVLMDQSRLSLTLEVTHYVVLPE